MRALRPPNINEGAHVVLKLGQRLSAFGLFGDPQIAQRRSGRPKFRVS
jgi:hypothetical protein